MTRPDGRSVDELRPVSFHPLTNPSLKKDIHMIIVNTETVPGRNTTATLGLVTGNTIRSKHVGSDIGASLKSIVGGELKGYTDMLTKSREEALSRMRDMATGLGANAIVNVRFTTAQVAGNAAELLAYGTAVTID